MATKANLDDPIIQRLDTLIRLQTQIALSSFKEQKEKVMFLTSVGVGPKGASETLGISVETVKSILKRARKAMREPGAQGED